MVQGGYAGDPFPGGIADDRSPLLGDQVGVERPIFVGEIIERLAKWPIDRKNVRPFVANMLGYIDVEHDAVAGPCPVDARTPAEFDVLPIGKATEPPEVHLAGAHQAVGKFF